MKSLFVLAVALPLSLSGAPRSLVPGEVILEIRAADTTRAVDVTVTTSGALLRSVGVMVPAPGRVHCAGNCVATTPAVVKLTQLPGAGRLTVSRSSPEMEVTVIDGGRPRCHLVAWGRDISFRRDDDGRFRIAAPRMSSRC
jgi:hypothetical protein